MIVGEEFLKKLRSAFDLNIYEAKIWAALLSKGVATAGELSQISNVPRSRAYDVLESLEKSGFVIMKIGKPIRYLAIKPEDVFKKVKKQLHERAEEQVKMLENVEKTDVMKELHLLFTNGIENVDPMNLSTAVKGRKNVYEHLSDVIENAEKSVTIITTPQGFVRKTEYFGNLLKKLANKGIKVRIATKFNDDVKKVLDNLDKSIKVKHVDNITARFVVVDGKNATFMISNDSNIHEANDTAIWVNSPFFASALDNLFNQVWG